MHKSIRVLVGATWLLACAFTYGGAFAAERSGFYSPVELDEIKRDGSMTLSDSDSNYTKISKSIPGQHFVDRIVEYRMEDYSAIELLKNGVTVFKIAEASSYWGYRVGGDLEVFVVYEFPPMGPGGRKPKYHEYTLVRSNPDGFRSYNCVFRGRAASNPDQHTKALRSPEGGGGPDLDLTPYFITRTLSVRGVDFKTDRCSRIPAPAGTDR